MPHDDDAMDLSSLYEGRIPRPELEDSVVDDLRSAGLLGPDRRRRPRLAALAAGIALFLAGWGAGSWTDSRPTEPDGFMMLLLEGPDFGAGTDPATFAAAYAGWARDVAADGVRISGNELSLDRVTLGAPTPDGVVGGYFLVDALDLAQARSIAETHPHLGHGGWIEIAPIVER